VVIPAVPTLVELVEQGHARVVERNSKGVVTYARPDPEGQQMIYEAMAKRAAYARLRLMRALDPEGTTDHELTHEPVWSPPRCLAVNAGSGLQCSKLAAHDGAHSIDVSWETTKRTEQHRLGLI
jgi:hypothetical protein